MFFMKNWPARTATALVRFISLFFRALGMRGCRFSPTCSEYSAEAFCAYGFFSAGRLSLYRILRCHPFTEGGHDPLLRPAGR